MHQIELISKDVFRSTGTATSLEATKQAQTFEL
jgi:hypothetical protein